MKIIGKPFNYETFNVYNPFKVKKNKTLFQQKKNNKYVFNLFYEKQIQ